MIGNDGGKRKILILYEHRETHVKTIADYLESFHRFSRHNVSYVTSLSKCHFELDYFDAVVVHYSVRLCFPGHLSASFAQALKGYRGLKILFIQDEYDHTHAAHQQIRELGIGLVFTCVPEESIAKVYPPAEFPTTKFVNVLTGYVPIELRQMKSYAPIRERSILIGYRGRSIGYWYGDLGQEKQWIGARMKAICNERGLATDIAWDEKSRIYGDRWFDFLGQCKATLGTESGANIFDFDGTLAATVKAEMQRNPDLSYEEVHRRFLSEREGAIPMNQISPKVFEAIACRTALVLFEGRYSGVLEPGTHYLSLKKDFSNVDDVLAKLHDDALLEAMTERAFADIIGEGRYSYQAFVKFWDDVLEAHWRPATRGEMPWLPLPPCDALPTFAESYGKNFQAPALKRAYQAMPAFLRTIINRERLARFWSWCPSPIRACVRAIVKPAH